MQSKVMENNAAHVEYANDVFTTANDNVNSLRQSIIDNQNASNEAVEKGLEDAKSVKESTSGQNQDLMKSFTEKLSYTRLGSLENTTTYKFIANPMVGVDESKDAVKILDSVKIGGADEVKSAVGQETGSTDGTKKRTVNVDKAAEPVKVITYVLVAALVLALAGLGGYICYLRKARRRHQMDY
jgi:phage-related tail protein